MSENKTGKEIKLLRPFTGTGCVFFPIGLPPKGTCEFATKKCLTECYAVQEKFPHYDIELAVPEEEKCIIYDYVIKCSTKWIVEKMVRELDGLQTSILHWFGSGDCLTKDISKISEIIKAFSSNITQMGFTRNFELWSRHRDIFALTIENKRNLPETNGGEIFSIPDYRKETTNMYCPVRDLEVTACGPLCCKDKRDKSREHYINCCACKSLRMGCFDRIKKEG